MEALTHFCTFAEGDGSSTCRDWKLWKEIPKNTIQGCIAALIAALHARRIAQTGNPQAGIYLLSYYAMYPLTEGRTIISIDRPKGAKKKGSALYLKKPDFYQWEEKKKHARNTS